MPTFSEQEREQIKKIEEDRSYRDELREVFRKISQGLAKINNRSYERAIWELLQNAGDYTSNGPACVELTLTDSDLYFKHHGLAFTLKTLEDLIRQRSSKNDKTKVGRFGTGFMTTHVFSRKVYLSGSCYVELGGKSSYLPFNEFCLNRDFTDPELFVDEADIALRKRMDITEGEGSDIDIYPTIFRYPLSPEKVETISNQIEKTSILMPYVLTFNDTISECTIRNEFSNTTIVYSKIDEIGVPQGDSGTLLWKTIIEVTRDGQTKPDTITVRTLRNTEGTDRVVIPELPKGYEVVGNIPSQFLFFPLLGTENFGTNFIFHSARLTPTEPRDSYELPKDNDNLIAVYKENERVLDEMIKMLFEFYRNNKEEQKNISVELAHITFAQVASKRAADNVEEAYYHKLHKLFSDELASYAMIPYKEDDGEQTKYASINEGVIKVIDPTLLKSLTEEQIKDHIAIIISFARKVAHLPSDNEVSWSYVAGDWDSKNISWYVTLEDICAGIKNQSDDLHAFLQLLKDLGQIGTDLMKKYALIPNREGVLCTLGSLRSGKNIPVELYNKVKPIIREKADAIVDLDYEDIFSLTEYTRANLRDDISSAIDKLKDDTINRKINYTLTPRLLDQLEKTTTVEDLVAFCSVYPTENPESLRSAIMPVLAEFYGISTSNVCIPNEKIVDGSQPVDLYTRTFNFLVEHTMYFISTKNEDWLIQDEDHEINHRRLLKFVSIYANSAKTNLDNMERLKKYSIFPNQLGKLCCLNDNKLKKNEKIDEDIVELYLKVMKDDLKEYWVDENFKDLYEFNEELPIEVGRRMEDTLRPYLENKRKSGAEFNIEEHYETALLTIVNNLEKGEWVEYFDFFANETNLRNVSYELGTPEQKDALYKIKLNTNQSTLERLAEIAENPNISLILDKAEAAIRKAEEEQRQFNFMFAIGKLIEDEIARSIGSVLKVEFSQSIEEFTATDEQNGQDIIIRKNGTPVYYIECKAKWNFTDSPAHMSSQQMKQAVRERDNYALCCIDCTSRGCSVPPKATQEEVLSASEDILAHTYVHTDIGHKLKNALEALITEEDSYKTRSGDEQEGHIGIYSNLTCNIPYKVFSNAPLFKIFIYNLTQSLSQLI